MVDFYLVLETILVITASMRLFLHSLQRLLVIEPISVVQRRSPIGLPSMSIAVSPAQPAVLLLLLLPVFLLSAARSEGLNSVSVSRDLCPVSQYDGDRCPVNCFRPDPVCGQDGLTYWCGCPDAACAGVSVVKIGACEVGNGGSGLVSGQAFLLIHIIWLIVLGFSVLCGLL